MIEINEKARNFSEVDEFGQIGKLKVELYG